MSRLSLPDTIRKWGVPVIEVSGWQTRGWLTNRYGGVWDPHGAVCHHTANAGFRGVDAPSLPICINGRPDLAGPLCQIVLGYSGTAYLIAGRGANHAGAGGWAGLKGNGSVWGIEAENNGVGEPWPVRQIDMYHRCVAALAEFSSFDPTFVCGHKEWTPQKIDPAGIDMGQFRERVRELLADEPKKEDDDMTFLVKDPDGEQAWWEVGFPYRRKVNAPFGATAELDTLKFYAGLAGSPVLGDETPVDTRRFWITARIPVES